jgi:ADP-ribose pyrophosphatase YjhB (NUDIX family)
MANPTSTARRNSASVFAEFIKNEFCFNFLSVFPLANCISNLYKREEKKTMNQNQVLISGAVVAKLEEGKAKWFLTRSSSGEEWEIPKVVVRKGESSVRAALRIMGEKGGMSTRVLEEAGRAGGSTTVGDKTVPQRHIYYLMLMRQTAGEAIGFEEYEWLDYAAAGRKLTSKREKSVLKQAKEIFVEWRKKRKKRKKKLQNS